MRIPLRLVPIGLLVAGCAGALDPAGPGASRIAGLWWVLFWVGLIPVVIVTVLLVMIATGKVAPGKDRGGLLTERRMILYGGLVLSTLLLVPVVAMTIVVERDIRQAEGQGEFTIEVIGHQYWWEVIYPGPDGENTVHSANEIHIPVGVPVNVRVTSNDVIHSIWVPEVQGKIDLIPGHTNEIIFHADREGVYRGQCAEFCGLGHAMMRLVVVASPADEFEEWLESESGPADIDVPTDTLRIFANSCAPCHTIKGVFDNEAFEGDYGPDLTHFASRRMIGANLLPNTIEAQARWIVDPQGVKPGNRMPNVGLNSNDLNAILELLGQLE